MTSQHGQQTIAIYILYKNQTIKFVQSIKYTMIKIFIKNHTQNESERLVSDYFLFFKKTLYEIKASGLHLSFNIFW